MATDIIFRQLFDKATSTYTYLLADRATGEAVIIDSVYEQLDRDMTLIKQLGLKLVCALETHIHADHVTASWALKQAFACQIVLPENSGGLYADRFIKDNEVLEVGRLQFKALHTPGHTDHHMCYLYEDRVFTGDALLINACGRTDFQSGDAATLFDAVHSRLFTLPDETLVFTGHDYHGLTATTIGEQKQFNPRFAKKSKNQFIEMMDNLNLAYPYRIIKSVPKNLISFNQDKLIDALKASIDSKTSVLNLGKDSVLDTLAVASQLDYQTWQIATLPEFQTKMANCMVKSKVKCEPLLTLDSNQDWGLKKSYDCIYAESLFDEMPKSDIIYMAKQVFDHLNDNGAFCLYSQFIDDEFPTHQEINTIWQTKNSEFGLKIYNEVNKIFEQHGMKVTKTPLEVGFSLCVWQR